MVQGSIRLGLSSGAAVRDAGYYPRLGKGLPETTDLPDFFANKAGVLLEGGNGLFVGNAAGYIRLNLAMPRSIIETVLTRMVEVIRKEQE